MAAYMIVDSNVLNPEVMKDYGAAVPVTLKAHGGRPIANSNDIDFLEGKWQPKRAVIVEFPSIEAEHAWYNSPEYQAIIPLRTAHSEDSLVFIDGAVGVMPAGRGRAPCPSGVALRKFEPRKIN